MNKLVESFEEFKLMFKELIGELRDLNNQISDIKNNIAEINEDLTEIYGQLDMLAQLKTISTFLKEISEKISGIQMMGVKEEVEKVIGEAKRAVKLSQKITPNQHKYIHTLMKILSDAENKDVDEISNEIYRKYGKKITDLSINEASELIDYLKDRIRKARKK